MQRLVDPLKPLHLISPLVALGLVVAWNASQRQAISTLERQQQSLRWQIRAADSTPLTKPNSTTPAISTAPRVADWRGLATELVALRGGSSRSGMQAILEFQRRIAEMSQQEILAALDAIAAMDLSPDARDLLEAALAGRLARLDPKALLTRHVDKLAAPPSVLSGQLPAAMREWAKQDDAAASQWLNDQIAAGHFDSKTLDGRNDLRSQFEAVLLESLLGADLQSAASRLAAIPEDQRREVLEKLPFANLTASERELYAHLIRQFIPADERAGSFAHLASQLLAAQDDESLSHFLDAVQATAEERTAAARQLAESQIHTLSLAGEVRKEDVDQLRSWLDRQAPGQTEMITGKALAEAAQKGGRLSFDDASQLVLHYQNASGRDEVLIGFLTSYSARSNFEQAQPLLEMIADPQRRAEILAQLK
jgi:hypothetical protein